MIKVNYNQPKAAAKATAKRFPVTKYGQFALKLLETYSPSGEFTDKEIASLKEKIAAYASGTLTADGYSIYVRYLMGAISARSKELADALRPEDYIKEYAL